ncbi:MAG: hypothetical protein HKN25_16430 [Pyrinomonadaceae bacterium]|nr:hypothetical protein [Pyrinomonadaceae bacterium]
MSKKVSLVEINVFEKMIPLVSGYLESYASSRPEIKTNFDFNKYSSNVAIPEQQILRELIEQDSDIYAFSCYLWNTDLVRRLLPALRKEKPNSHYLLGGPQVMHQAHEHLSPEFENTLICNGEGERTFANFLGELLNTTPKFSNVKGLSFYGDGELVTTKPQERITELDKIPSPYLNGIFDDEYLMTVMETNRGCPFHCSFCFWGAATNDRVYKFSEERVRKEINWLSNKNVPFIFIADANWGMLKRDIEFSAHIAKCKKKNAAPVFVYFSAAKNSPQRVSEITEIFTESGLLNAQPISMQSLDKKSLEYVDRKNIRLSAYEELQDDLNERGISSFIELMFPLPGETLSSFKKGIESLFELRASVLVIYPHLLLLNTPLYEQRKQHKLITREVTDGSSEAALIVGTADISEEEFEEGMWFVFTILALFNTRTIHRLSYYLHTKGLERFSDLYTKFIEFCKQKEDNAFTKFCAESIRDGAYYDFTNYPYVYHLVLHQKRYEFDSLLYDFVSNQDWWADANARLLFEFDLLSKTFIYSNTDVMKPWAQFEFIDVISASDRNYTVEIPTDCLGMLDLDEKLKAKLDTDKPLFRLRLNSKGPQFTFRENQTRKANADYCYGSIMRISDFLPRMEIVDS